MNTTNPKQAPEKLTETVRGRVEPPLKSRLVSHAKKHDRTESYFVRRALSEFLDENEKKKAA